MIKETRLKEALYALNRAVPWNPDGWTYAADEGTPGARVVAARDAVFELGEELFGWTD